MTVHVRPFGLILSTALACAPNAPRADDAAPWMAAGAFELPAERLRAAASAVPRPDAPTDVLLEGLVVRFDEQGRETMIHRTLYRVLTQAGVSGWDAVRLEWSPWRQPRPVVRARVVREDGVEHVLDPATLSDSPAGSNDSDVYSDRRVLAGPLPFVGPGAVVEVEWTMPDQEPLFGKGFADRFVFGFENASVLATRVLIDAPRSLAVKTRLEQLPGMVPRRDEEGDRVHLTFEIGRLDKHGDLEPDVPFDTRQLPSIGFSTVASWADVARAYDEIVEHRLAEGRVPAPASPPVRAAKTRDLKIAAALRDLHKRVRYTGVEFGQASVVPARAEETLARGYGDCKDKSLALVAMLRAAGLDAHLALLNSGSGPDVDPELPGPDDFDHAIVRVEGEPPIWIDATAESFRAGDLPLGVEGRKALVASASTTGLTTIPDLAPERERLERTREVWLAEIGPARVRDSRRYGGTIEADSRARWMGKTDAEARETLVKEAKAIYKAKALDANSVTPPSDLSKPFEVSYQISDQSAWTSGVDGAKVVFPSADFVATLDDLLPEAPEPANDTGKARTLPFRLPRPVNEVWTYRIHLPPGFAAGTPPAFGDETAGPVVWRRTWTVEPDGTAVFESHLDTGSKRIWSPEDLSAVRAFVTRVKGGEPVRLLFDLVGYKCQKEGRVRDSVTAFRLLTDAHPKEALHHAQLAGAFLEGGLGDAARAEARRAVAVEPGSVEAWKALGWVSLHDLLGRPFHAGADLPEAERAYRKAKEIDPKDPVARVNLAILLEYGAGMVRYGRGARSDEAIDEWRSLRKDLDLETYDGTLMVTLARCGRWKELRELAQDPATKGVPNRATWQVCAAAILDGRDAAIALAGQVSSDGDAKVQLLRSAALTLVQVREYAKAAELLGEIPRSGTEGPDSRTSAALIARCRRHETLDLSGPGPEMTARRFFRDLLVSSGDATAPFDYFTRKISGKIARDDFGAAMRQGMRTLRGAIASAGMTPDGIADLVLSMVDIRAEGTPTAGYKVTMSFAVPGQNGSFTSFWVPENGPLRLLAIGNTVDLIGSLALDLLDEQRLDDAKTWLTWARDSFATRRADPFLDPPFLSFWPPDPALGELGVRLAAASLATGGADAERAVRVLLDAASSQRLAEADRWKLDHALATAYRSLDRWSDALPPAERIYRAHRDSDEAFWEFSTALMVNKRFDELETECVQRDKDGMSVEATVRARARAADVRNAREEAMGLMKRLVDMGKAGPRDYNGLAWDALLRGKVDDEAVTFAEKAALQVRSPNSGDVHTLASIYAEVGRDREARDALVKEMDLQPIDEPQSSEWYVIGRLAEGCGAVDSALAAFARVKPPDDDFALAGSPWTLAQRRIAALKPHAAAR